MTQKTRITLLLSLTFLFLVISPLTIFYSLGWRIDWGNKRVIQSGIFYFKVLPKGTQVYVDGKMAKKTDFFFGSALIENLLPGKYEVEIRKDGFQPWKKVLEIKERSATEAKNIILLPEKTNFSILSKNVEEFFVSPDENKVILKEGNPNPEDKTASSWSLKLFDLEKGLKSHLFFEADLSKTENDVVSLNFSPDSKKIILKADIKGVFKYYIFELDKSPVTLKSLDFSKPIPEEVYFNPSDYQKLLIFDSKTLKENSLTGDTLSSIILEDIALFRIRETDIYYMDKSGLVFKTDGSFLRKEQLNTTPFIIKEGESYEIYPSGPRLFIKNGAVLYNLNEENKTFEILLESADRLTLSADHKKIAYSNGYEISVMFLDKKYDQPQKEEGEKMFVTRLSERIDGLYWLTDHYLIFYAQNKIKVVEIDDRDKINIFDLESPNISDFFWNRVNKKILILTEKDLHLSEKITP